MKIMKLTMKNKDESITFIAFGVTSLASNYENVAVMALCGDFSKELLEFLDRFVSVKTVEVEVICFRSSSEALVVLLEKSIRRSFLRFLPEIVIMLRIVA